MVAVSSLRRPEHLALPLGLSPSALRAALFLGLAVSLAVAAGVAQTAVADPSRPPDLQQLLRGMAALKGVMVAVVSAVLFWRFGHPVSKPLAVSYLVSVWLAASAALLIGQLVHLGAAALLFHVCEVVFLLALLKDARSRAGHGAAEPVA